MENYYAILKVSTKAEERTIRAAYRRLARRLHPDVNQENDAHERMVLINKAYDVLSDPIKKAEYDLHFKIEPTSNRPTTKRPTKRATTRKSGAWAYLTLAANLIGHEASVYSVAFNLKGTRLVSTSFDNPIYFSKLQNSGC